MSPKTNDSNLTVIFKGNPMNCQLIKDLLDTERITAYIHNQLMGDIAPWHISAGGFQAVEVVVFEHDKEKALRLINAFNSTE